MAALGRRGSQMPPGRLNPSRPWNPADHPRDPLGKFALVGGGKRTARGSSHLDEPDAKRLMFDAMVGAGVVNHRQLDQMHSAGLIDTGMREDALGVIGPPPAPRVRMETPPPMRELGRGLDRESMSGVPQSQVESELAGYLEIDSPIEMDHDRSIDLSNGGVMNLGVRRGPLFDIDSGTDLPTEVVVKRVRSEEEASAELLASEVGHAIGSPSPVVVQDPRDPERIAMEAIPGTPGFQVSEPYYPDYTAREVSRYRESAARIAIQDQLVGNRDRHDGNWILTDDGMPVGIDNGLAFSAGEGRAVRSVEETRRVQLQFLKQMGAKSASWAEWSDRVSTDEMASWGPRLNDLRLAFEAHGRGGWHDQMMENYAYLMRERRAAGDSG